MRAVCGQSIQAFELVGRSFNSVVFPTKAPLPNNLPPRGTMLTIHFAQVRMHCITGLKGLYFRRRSAHPTPVKDLLTVSGNVVPVIHPYAPDINQALPDP